MSTGPLPPMPPSPGFGLRRKGLKAPPRLPMSAFSPPNSGTSERFPLPASPSALNPEKVLDAHVIISDDDANLDNWKKAAGPAMGERIGGVVVSLEKVTDVQKTLSEVTSADKNGSIVSVVVPFRLEDPIPSEPPAYLSSSSIPITLTTVYTQSSPQASAGLRWALQQGRPVDIDLQVTLTETSFEAFEDLLTKSTAELPKIPPIMIRNFLPPPDNIDLPIVKLMNHPSYLAYQSQTAALSLFPDLRIKFLPPSWNAATPNSPPPGATFSEQDNKQTKEWKRRIKMYLSPVVEAFGYERIVFGSSPSASSPSPSNAGDWYELARESLAELGVEQEAVDAVFALNARKVYQS
ncbi:Amidohydrolase-related domain-containing protein [Pleurotus pulmonarius]|nr:hypothetical protein EYR38_006923 [Pleurotus pulmonarius]